MQSKRTIERACRETSSFRNLLHLLFFISATTRGVDIATAYSAHGFVHRQSHRSPQQSMLFDKSVFFDRPRQENRAPRISTSLRQSTTLNSPINGTFTPQTSAVLVEKLEKIEAVAPVVKDNSFVRHVFSCLFCFSSGFGDVKAVRNYGGPINMCTGSIIKVMLAVMDCRWGAAWVPSLQVAFFICGSMTSRLAQKAVEASNQWLHRPETKQNKLTSWLRSLTGRSKLCLVVIPLILGAFGLANCNYQCQRTCVAAQAFGYGLINTAAQEVTGGPIVFAVTGHLIGASTATVDKVASTSPPSAKTILMRSSLILSFIVGVAGAVFMWDHLLPRFLGAHVSDRIEHILMGVWYSTLFALCSRRL